MKNRSLNIVLNQVRNTRVHKIEDDEILDQAKKEKEIIVQLK